MPIYIHHKLYCILNLSDCWMCYPYTRVPPLTLLHLAVSHPRSSMLVYISCMQFYGFLLLFEIRVVRVLFVKNVFRSRALCMCDYADTVKCLCLVFFLLLGICSFFGSDKSARLGWLTLNHVARYLRKSFDFGKICFGTHLYATTWKSPRKDTIDKREIDKERHNSWTEKKNQRTHKYIWSRCRTKCASMQQQQHPRFNFETGFSSLFPVIARSPALGSQSLCLSLVLNSRIVFAYCVGWFFFRALYLLQILWGIVYIITRIISFRVGLNVHKFIHNKYVALLHVFIGSCNFDLDVSNFLPSTHTKSHICCWLSSSSSSLKWYLRFAIEIHRIMQRTWTVLVL